MNHLPKISFFTVLLVFLSAVSSPRSSAQSKEQLKQQAEEKLKNLSPEEVDAKLKELGISRWEAIRKAQDLGITLEDFLGKQSTSTETPQGQAPLATTDTTGKALVPTAVKLVPPKPLTIPGFTGRIGIDSTIRPFGYDLFNVDQSVFQPNLNIATPASYLLGPGDALNILVWGETKLNFSVHVNREGNVVLPEVGPVSANGQTIEQFKSRLLRQMTRVYSGLRNGSSDANTYLDVSLGSLRTIQVFVLGEVKQPGAYSLSSMSTVFQALYSAGGPTVQGTMRNIHVSREGKSLPVIDLYDYLAKGDRSTDIRLQDGDVVYVYPAKRRVAVIGTITRPAIYELKDKETMKDLLANAGGTRFDTDIRRVHIERVIPFDQRKDYDKDVLDLDLKFSTFEDLQGDSTPFDDGDIVTFFRASRYPENRVYITGSVTKPGPFQLVPGMRIRDLVMAADSLARGTFMDRGILLRMLPNLRRETIPFVPSRMMEGMDDANLPLQNEDSVIVFRELDFRPTQRVAITGAIRKPDYYTRYNGMTINDLVMEAGGLTEGAELTGWEISRLDTTSLGVYAKVIKVQHPFSYDETSDDSMHILKDFDYVFVPFSPRFTIQKFVDVQGYVLYPGPYPLRYEGEKLSDVIRRAGGLRPGAYLKGSRIYRRGAIGEQILRGQIPIDFETALSDTSSRDNLVLYERDSIYISYVEDVVRVNGEVFVPSAILYKKGEGVQYYLDQAGGLKDEADGGRVYVLLPGGKKWEGGGFLGLGGDDILPGSSIYVPRKIEKEDKTLPVLRDFATILASLAAITVAIVQVTKK